MTVVLIESENSILANKSKKMKLDNNDKCKKTKKHRNYRKRKTTATPSLPVTQSSPPVRNSSSFDSV